MKNKELNKIYEEILSLPNLQINEVEILSNVINIYCELRVKSGICPSCGQHQKSVNQSTEIKLRDLNISEKEVWLYLTKRQFYCPDCDRYYTEQVEWAEPSKGYTKRQSKFIFSMCKEQSFAQVACLTNMNAKTVERIYYAQAQRAIKSKDNWNKIRYLGIDEISNRKGKKEYCCVLTNLETGEQIEVLADRKKATLSAYFQKLGTAICSKIQGVCFDMWDAYAGVAKACFPNAICVVDRFHLVKAMNDSLNILRKEIRKEDPKNPIFKDIKWCLSKRFKDCTSEELESLDKAFMANEQLAKAYQFKEAFHNYLDYAPDKQWFNQQLDHWQNLVEQHSFSCFDKFLKTLSNWKEQIVNFASLRISNAATEGLNNIIRHIKRFSFGMYNFEHLRLRVLARFCA